MLNHQVKMVEMAVLSQDDALVLITTPVLFD